MSGVSFTRGLVRIAAFVLVGTAIVVSTNILRSDDPAAAADQMKRAVGEAVLALVQEPAAAPAGVAQPEAEAGGVPDVAPAPATEPTVPRIARLAEVQAATPAPDLPARCESPEAKAGSVTLGDKVQLRFFARVGVPTAAVGDAPTDSAAQMAFERLDLSGIYEVGEDGTAPLPLIGRIALTGRDLPCVEAIVSHAVAGLDGSVTSVTASFAARLPVAVSGAVRAPGTYPFSPGLTVNRLLALAGATFAEGPMTPQEFETLVSQRDELQRREIDARLELGRLRANLSGSDQIVLGAEDLVDAAPDLVAPLLAAQNVALQQDLAVTRMTGERNAAALAALRQRLESNRTQLAQVEGQISSLKARSDEMNDLKSRGLLQASQLDVLLSNLMELNRIRLQLETDGSNLASEIDVAVQDAKLAEQQQRQDLSHRVADLSNDLGLYAAQRGAIDKRLAAQGMTAAGSGPDLGLTVSVQRAETDGTYRFDATLDTPLFPGDMVSVLLPPLAPRSQLRVDNSLSGGAGSPSSGLVQQ